MRFYFIFAFLFGAFFILSGVNSSVYAQQTTEQPNYVVRSGTLGAARPIPLSQILSGSTTGSAVGSTRSGTIQPYVSNTSSASGAAYQTSMSPSQVMQNRARRDAMAQAQSQVANEYMSQSYLDGEYQKAFDRYQQQFRTTSGSSSSSSSNIQSSKVRVQYNKPKQKNFVTPQRVFRSY